MDIAKYTVIGRLVRDPEQKETKAGDLTRIVVAVNRKVGGEDHASFFDIEGWDKTAERLATFEKGQVGYFEGELLMNEYQMKNKDGDPLMTDEGKPQMRRVMKMKCFQSRYGQKSGEGATSPPKGPKGQKGKKGPAGDEEDSPF